VFFKLLAGLHTQSTENNNFCYSLVLDDELVSIILHANPFGFNDTRVDRQKLGKPRLKPVPRPVYGELANLCEENEYQLFSRL
jgi:hypothetical protein